jgi:RNA polymerase sigma-70 factor (ECF subfamily)
MIPMDREQILSQLRERIVGFAASRLSREVGEDLAQEVMIVLHEKYGHVTRLEELVPLSFQILRFKIWETRRKSLRRAEHTHVSLDEIQIADNAGNPGIETERKELLEQLLKAIDSLGARCRQLFLWKLEEKSFPEIQKLFGVGSINTIYTWDFRCRKQLLEKMGGAWEYKREGRKQ